MISPGRVAQLVALAACGQAWLAHAECAFRLDGKLNIDDDWTLIAPVVDYTAGHRVINEYNPIVYLVDEAAYDRYNVNCSVDSWKYQTAGGAWSTVLTYPDSDSNTTNTELVIDRLFEGGKMSGIDQSGSFLWIDSYDVDVAVAISDTLFNRTIELTLTCDQYVEVAKEDSCVQFNLNFTNSSPEPNEELFDDTLYRFEEPAVPSFILPPSGNSSPGDYQLNPDNRIVDLDGTSTQTACNGDLAEYQGEDGEWYFYFTGSDGQSYNLTHVFYASFQDRVLTAKIQEPWSPNLEAALFNRMIRLKIYCNNIDVREEGYILFTVGDNTTNFDIYTAEYAVLSPSTRAAPAGWLSLAFSLAAAVALAAVSVAGPLSQKSPS